MWKSKKRWVYGAVLFLGAGTALTLGDAANAEGLPGVTAGMTSIDQARENQEASVSQPVKAAEGNEQTGSVADTEAPEEVLPDAKVVVTTQGGYGGRRRGPDCGTFGNVSGSFAR